MDLGLTGARALVTGGSSGLGAAIADALAAESVDVAIAARESEHLSTVAARVKGLGIPVDLSTPHGPEAAVAEAIRHLGGLDLLVVNSGGPVAGSFSELSDQDWETSIDGTIWSSIRLIRAGLTALRASDRPAILVVLSSSVRVPIAGLTTSNVLRPGLAGLVKSLVSEAAPIRINGVAPGRVLTGRVAEMDRRRAIAANTTVAQIRQQTVERVPLGRYGEPREVGSVAAFLLSPAAGYVTGAIVAVDGGLIQALP